MIVFPVRRAVPATSSILAVGAVPIAIVVPLSRRAPVPKLSVSVNRAVYPDVPPPSILAALNGIFIHPVPPLVQRRLALRSQFVMTFPLASTRNLSVIATSVPIATVAAGAFLRISSFVSSREPFKRAALPILEVNPAAPDFGRTPYQRVVAALEY